MKHWRPVLRIPAPRSLHPRRSVTPFQHNNQQCMRCFAVSHKKHRGSGSSVRGALLDGIDRARDRDAAELIQAHLVQREADRVAVDFGGDVAPHYEPADLLENPPSAGDVSIELLLASQTHLGHSTSLWHPANSKYIFGVREGIHIISLDITAALLRRAATVVAGVVERGGVILFAGTRKGQDQIVVRAAQLSGACHLFEKWLPGSITNGQQILGRCESMVVDQFDREIAGFADQLDNRPVLKPDLVVCLNTLENYVMLHECALAGIPTIGIIDTDANPSWVTYPIPANDDSLRSVALIGGVLGRAGKEGLARRHTAAMQGLVTHAPPEGLEPLQMDGDGADGEDAPAARAPRGTKSAPVEPDEPQPSVLTEGPDPALFDEEAEDAPVPRAVMFERPDESPQEAPNARRNVEKEEQEISEGAARVS